MKIKNKQNIRFVSQRFLNTSRYSLVFFLLLATYYLLPTSADAARIYFYPHDIEMAVGEEAIAELRIDTEGETINAFELKGNVAGISGVLAGLETGGSIASIFPEPPAASGREFIFIGGIPFGFKGDGLLGRVRLLGEAPGSFSLSFSSSSRVYLHGPNAATAPLSSGDNLAIRAKPAKEAGVLSSRSHPDQNKWSFERNFYITWEPVRNAEYSYLISHLQTETPDAIPDSPVGEIKFENLESGIYYFSFCRLTAGECGETYRRRAMIDSAPPEWVSVDVSRGVPETQGKTYVSFAARDEHSGIAGYRVFEKGVSREAVSPYLVSAGGEITLEAYDRAGNSVRREVDVAQPMSSEARKFILFGVAGMLAAAIFAYLLKRKRYN